MPGNLVCNGAECKCSQGSKPANLTVTLQTLSKIAGKAVATVNDCLPGVSFLPPVATFGPCKSMPLPAGGYAPCMPAFPAPWSPGSALDKIQGMKALTKESELNCALGGKISIADPKCGVDVSTR
jgi:hypothetical protein